MKSHKFMTTVLNKILNEVEVTLPQEKAWTLWESGIEKTKKKKFWAKNREINEYRDNFFELYGNSNLEKEQIKKEILQVCKFVTNLSLDYQEKIEKIEKIVKKFIENETKIYLSKDEIEYILKKLKKIIQEATAKKKKSPKEKKRVHTVNKQEVERVMREYNLSKERSLLKKERDDEKQERIKRKLINKIKRGIIFKKIWKIIKKIFIILSCIFIASLIICNSNNTENLQYCSKFNELLKTLINVLMETI